MVSYPFLGLVLTFIWFFQRWPKSSVHHLVETNEQIALFEGHKDYKPANKMFSYRKRCKDRGIQRTLTMAWLYNQLCWRCEQYRYRVWVLLDKMFCVSQEMHHVTERPILVLFFKWEQWFGSQPLSYVDKGYQRFSFTSSAQSISHYDQMGWTKISCLWLHSPGITGNRSQVQLLTLNFRFAGDSVLCSKQMGGQINFNNLLCTKLILV